MRQDSPKDTTARTARRAIDEFDCELPDDALDELLTPKRPRILGRPVKASHGLHRLGVAVLMLVLVAVIVAIALIRHQAPTVTPAVLPAASPQPMPPVQPLQPTAAVEHVVEQPILPPRAQLLKLPTPRATVVRLPAAPPRGRLPQPSVALVSISSDHIDEAHDITMPYGTVVRAKLRGFLEQENQLPQVGYIGDMYVVGSAPWIFIQVPGTTAPTWVDP